ncbi:cordon-bleu WH2 repeat protein [Willisornis vidua]|uniref:Cordon-bleu WH2 repeat protein n=1 Tax=Willisornis vidua TaxID=1566151 RepID=A0ABQ9D0Z7_9PASS|nr:cordon-bleu WH2 repeat protein [Willisornis vidua]
MFRFTDDVLVEPAVVKQRSYCNLATKDSLMISCCKYKSKIQKNKMGLWSCYGNGFSFIALGGCCEIEFSQLEGLRQRQSGLSISLLSSQHSVMAFYRATRSDQPDLFVPVPVYVSNNFFIHGTVEEAGKRKRMKARAPPPPNQPSAASRIHSERKSPAETAVVSDQNLVSMKENMINRLVDFTVILPSGVEQKSTVQGRSVAVPHKLLTGLREVMARHLDRISGKAHKSYQKLSVCDSHSKAVMDVLVDLCSQYRLNPSQHSLELKSSGTQQVLSYKPNTLIGALDVETVLLKEKVPEEKPKRPLPRVPEKSVRLVVNYLKTQKAVVRVSPEVPLHNIIPAICEKCEVSQEHIVLLRDGITGEELELTKSLEELGIKELYAWDRKKVPPSKTQSEPSLNYREPNRKASVSNDAIEKEKTRLLGLFNADRSSSKTEEYMRMNRDCEEDVFSSASTSEGSLDVPGDQLMQFTVKDFMSHGQGFSTAPNSPSVNSRSSGLGPSLSLGNISGMTANPEVKKRRAPPPPVATPVLPNADVRGQEKTAAQISKGASLNDLRKKKRRAPLPPAASAPPTPAMPNRTEDREDKRKSTMGDGRQVPQKPPRGTTRGPPQLVIPPPPPYPPPGSGIVDPTVCYRDADVTAPTELVPKQSLLSTRDNVYVVDDTVLELSEVEETASESSCFASEDTTEDSGVMSSPSDIVSLDSQNDSMKLRDIKLVNGYTDSAEVDGMCSTEAGPAKNTSCHSVGSDSAPQRQDETMVLAKHENEDTFIATQLQQTLADLNEDLEAVDDISNSDSDYSNEALNPHTRKNEVAQDISISVPVTVIDDAPEVSTSNSEENQEMEMKVPQNSSINSINTGYFTNKNNNAGSFDKGHTGGGAVCISKDLIRQQPSENEFSHLPVEQRRDMFESLASSFEKRTEKNLRLELSPKHGVKSEERKSKLSPSHCKTTAEINTAKEKINPFNEYSSRERSLKKSKSELEIKWPPAKKVEVEEVPSTPTWCHRAQNSGSNYEPKMGLTTFKVVPPKPEVRHFDRGVSLSTGAIKIDELGNLIGPNTGVSKHIPDSSSDESEEIHIGRVKAFWRSSSMEKQSDDSAEHFPKKSAVPTSSKPFTVKHEHKPVCLAVPKPVAPQTVTSQVTERQSENERTRLPLPVTQSQVIPLAVPAINKDKLELPFTKPHRRTSSQYVASAIARHISATTFKSDTVEYHEKDENKQGAGEVKTEAEVSPKRCIIVAKYSPVEAESAETRETLSSIFTSSQKASHRFTPGDNSSMENKIVNIRAPNQATPLSFYKKNGSVPLTKSSSKDNNSAEEDHGLNSKQSIAEKKARLMFDQKCETLAYTNSGSSPKSPDLQGIPSSFGSSLRVTKWPPANSVSSFKTSTELNGAPANAELEQEEKPDDSDINAVSEGDVNVQTNIFGPKKKFKPVVQKPVPKDTSLHSALMEAIQTGGGKEKLRKVSNSALNGNHRKPSYTEPENARLALLSAIRGHSGTSKLKKISSLASEELQRFRDAELSLKKAEDLQEEQLYIPPAPAQPPPPPPTQLSAVAPKSSATVTGNPLDAREALMEAIRSGAGAAKLRKYPQAFMLMFGIGIKSYELLIRAAYHSVGSQRSQDLAEKSEIFRIQESPHSHHSQTIVVNKPLTTEQSLAQAEDYS